MKKLQQWLGICVLIYVSAIGSELSGQTLTFDIDSSKYEMTAYTLEDGLPDPNVSTIAQDKDGYIWIGTKSSLSRFDGRRFVNYSNFDKDHFIRRNTINNISIDAKGRLILATDVGIEILDPKSNEIQSILPVGDKGLVGELVHTALIDDNERLWVSTDRGYSFQYSDDYKTFVYGPSLLAPNEFNHYNHIVSNLVEGDQFIYASAGSQEIWKIAKNTGAVSNYKPKDSLTYESPASPYDIKLDNEGVLWAVYLNNGLSYLDEEASLVVFDRSSKLRTSEWRTAISVTQNGSVWTGGINLLTFYDRTTQIEVDLSHHLKEIYKNSRVRIIDVFEDVQGNIWIGSDRGLLKISQKHSGFKNHYQGQAIYTLEEGADRKIFVGKFYTVEMYDPSSGMVEILPIKNNDDKGSSDFHIDPSAITYHDSVLWVRGYSSYDFKSKDYNEDETESWFDYVHEIDDQDRHWVGGVNLMEVRVDKESEYKNYKDPVGVLDLEDLTVSALCKNHDGGIWVGTNDGLYLIDYAIGTKESYQHDDPDPNRRLSDAAIYHIHQTTDGDLWLATDGGGLTHVNRKESLVATYSTKDGLPSNFLKGVLSQGDTVLWMSTNNGLSRFDISQKSFSNFGINDGLINSVYQKFSFLKTKDGQFFFGGDRGLDAFYPSDLTAIATQEESHNLVLTRVGYYNGLDRKTIDVTGQVTADRIIELKHNDRSINIEFALMDLSHPYDHLYSWRMSGFEDLWSAPSSVNQVGYSQLPAGDYNFEVKASNKLVTKDKPQLTIAVHVAEVWYKQLWFQFLMLSFLVVALYTIPRWRYREKLKKQEELDALRTKISSDLHDDVGSMLAGLSMQAQILEFKAKKEDKESLNQISEISRDAMETMRDTVWAIDSRQDRYINLVDRMRDFAENSLFRSDINYKIVTEGLDDTDIILPNIRQQLYLIYKEAVTNIIKHANATHVVIQLLKSDSILILSIKDNGSGRIKKLSSGQGLSNMKMRAERINGTLQLVDDEGLEVRVKVNVA